MLDQARLGAAEGLVAVADVQTQGRGRHGRPWVGPAGTSVLMSVLVRPPVGSHQLHLAVAAVALSACDACEGVAGFRPALKWPNDLVVGDRKLGGVLAELDGGAVVVGLGLNVAEHAELPPGATSIAEVAVRSVHRPALLSALLTRLGERCRDWPSVASAYRRSCSTLGRLVRVELGDEAFTGTAADVSDDGQLLVDVGMCLRSVVAGDVVHLRPA